MTPAAKGPFERERERLLNLSARSNFKWSNQSWRWNDLASGRCRSWTPVQVSEESRRGNFKSNFSFFTSLSTGEAHVFGVKFIGLHGTVGFIAIRDFSFWGEIDLWSDVWPAMDGVVSLLTEVSHDKAEWKICRRHTNVSRPLRKPSMAFLCRDVISLYVYRQA